VADTKRLNAEEVRELRALVTYDDRTRQWKTSIVADVMTDPVALAQRIGTTLIYVLDKFAGACDSGEALDAAHQIAIEFELDPSDDGS